jgi:hypothetical protein
MLGVICVNSIALLGITVLCPDKDGSLIWFALYDTNDSNNERPYFKRAQAAFMHEVTQTQQDF